MNVELKDISETRKTVVVSLDKSEVDGEYRQVVGQFSKLARLPGFRPGKAPPELVARRFGKEVQDEFRSHVVGKAYREGLNQAKVEVLSLVNVEEGTIEVGLSSAITFTVDVRPEFKLPEYLGISVELPLTEATDEEVQGIVERLRQERSEFKPVDRQAQQGDFVKLGYEGKVGDQPIAELVPSRPVLGKMPQTWEEVAGHEGIIPGMAGQLAGLKAGEKKEIQVRFPPEFAEASLAGKEAVYQVEIQEVRERVLPELNEAFLKDQGVTSIEELREQIRKNLKLQKEYENRASQRRQVSEAIASKVEFPLPDSLIESETETILRQFIEENMRRGITQEDFEKNKEQLFESARKAAAGRVKLRLILARIAEAEQIKVEDKDVNRYVMREATMTSSKPEKIVKELSQDRDRLRAVQQSILFDKTLDFLVDKSTVSGKSAKA